VIAAVVLAAGAATRFGSPKQEMLLGDVLKRLEATPVSETVVVEGAYPLAAALAQTPSVRVVPCADWACGPGASLRCGLSVLDPGAEAAVVVLADGPDLAPESVARVVERWRGTGEPLVAASYGGVRGHPLLVARSLWSEVPDEGFRLRRPLLVPCDDLGAPGDVDVPDDLPERFRRA
jgi:CTP:molybdopterin cytidylyltransferase MocA